MITRIQCRPARLAATIALGIAICIGALPVRAQPVSTELQNTIITSDRLEMRNTGVESHLVFIDNVHLTGTNLDVTCDRVEIYAIQQEDESDKDKAGRKATIGKIGGISRILATGNVVISQEGRKATAGRAEVLPEDDKIILTESPVVTDTETQVTVSGERMTFFRGERYAQIEKPKVVGPAIPNLGFPSENAGDGTAPAQTPARAAPTPPSAP